MATLRVNYNQLESLGSQILAKGEEFQSLLNKVKDTNENLKSFWEGEDASAYTSAVTEQSVTMQRLADTIEEIGNFLKSAANAYREAMESNKGAINL